MGKTTGISWTDATWNPWMGCDKVSDGCKHCYAEREMTRYGRKFNGNVVRTSPATFNAPLKWNLPERSRIFVCSWSDFFHEAADDWRAEAWEIIRKLPQYNFLIPTKRIERVQELLPQYWRGGIYTWGDYLPNVWLGVSVENQETEWRMLELLNIPAKVHWVSFEPLLGPITHMHRTDWAVIGGESGPGCRPMDIEWARDIILNCNSPVFVKQLGGWPDTRHELSDFPEDLRVREFPQ